MALAFLVPWQRSHVVCWLVSLLTVGASIGSRIAWKAIILPLDSPVTMHIFRHVKLRRWTPESIPSVDPEVFKDTHPNLQIITHNLQ